MVSQTYWHESSGEAVSDVTVIGGGLAGLAVSIHLARAGFQVICFDPVIEFRDLVGESLDWSAPAFFQQLELRMEDLVSVKQPLINVM